MNSKIYLLRVFLPEPNEEGIHFLFKYKCYLITLLKLTKYQVF